MGDLPLSGIRVLDLSRLLPGPFCTLILSDLGAEVIKIEDPGPGDYLRGLPPARGDTGAYFLALNRDKRSLVVDLKQPRGRDLFLRLCEDADVVVESFRPGVLERLGLGYPVLRDRNRGLVLVSISGYGQDGPLSQRAGHDLNYLALAGVLTACRSTGHPPSPLPVQLADVGGGALWGAIGALAGLMGRRETGEGRHVDISMTEGALSFLIPELAAFQETRHEPRLGQGPLRGGHANYGVYTTKDGHHLAVGALEPKFWVGLCQALGRAPRPDDIPGPPEAQARLRAELQQRFLQKTRAEWEEILTAHDVCVEPVLSLAEVADHPHHAARRVFFIIDDPRRGPLPQTRTPLGQTTGHASPPGLGEHTDEILAEAGLSQEEIASLRRDGIVAGGRSG